MTSDHDKRMEPQSAGSVVVSDDGTNHPNPDTPVSPVEQQQLQEEKLETIRRAIAAGAYDSEELLHRAMERMIQRLEESASDEETS
ncbi:MAG: hypothetical protein KDA96_05285 [Planctomycetaceae bacterium]|nr:hypothetical protein [Planctomycetaceae bacterium]